MLSRYRTGDFTGRLAWRPIEIIFDAKLLNGNKTVLNCNCIPGILGRRALLACTLAIVSTGASASPESAGPPDPALLDDLVMANHILFDQGVVDGFGHVSARHDRDPSRYLLARSMAPALVTLSDVMEYDLDSTPVDPRGRSSYLERFIHGAIYRARPEVAAIVHSHSPAVIPFADTKQPLRAMYHVSAFLGSGVPAFEIRDVAGDASDMLIRTAILGGALASTLGSHDVALMRGHGSVAVGRSVRLAVYRAVYTEVNARLEAEALKLGSPTYLTEQEAKAAAAADDTQVDRPWALWRSKVLAR